MPLPGGKKWKGVLGHEGARVMEEVGRKVKRVKFCDFININRAIADAKRGDTVKPVLRISHGGSS